MPPPSSGDYALVQKEYRGNRSERQLHSVRKGRAVGIKRSKGKNGGKRTKSVPTSPKPMNEVVDPTPIKKPIGIVQVRENVAGLVRKFATEIATGAIDAAREGQLAHVKYLFELAGLYPAMEETGATRPEDSLTHTLLRRMGLPTEIAGREGDRAGSASTRFVEEAMRRRTENGNEDMQGVQPTDREVAELKAGDDAVE